MNSSRKSPGGNRGDAHVKPNFSNDYSNFKIGFNENRPPSNILAETRLIENLIFRPEKAAMAKEIVSPTDFYSSLRSKIYERILEFHESKRDWNLETLENSFQADPNFSKYEEFLDDLICFTGEAVGHHAKIIKDCANERKLISATYTANIGLFNGEGLEHVRSCLERVLAEVANVSA